jgi:uncharacterized damage-inducible protein DinB
MLDFAHIYDVLAQARAKLFDWIRPLTQEQYAREFPFGLRTLRATLVEIALTEWALAKWLRGEPVPPREQRPIGEQRQPTFADLETVWRAQAPQIQAIFAETRDWDRVMEWRIIRPGKTTLYRSATRAQIALQMLFHEVHHRAQAMAMLRQLGINAQTLDYIGFVQQLREEPETTSQ